MNNPFEYLKIKREEKERKELEEIKKREDKERQNKELSEEIRHQRESAFNSLNKSVDSLLDQLQQAAYPNCIIDQDLFRCCWSIQQRTSWTGGWDGELHSGWESIVSVFIEFNSQQQPRAFNLSRGNDPNKSTKIQVGLSLEELADGLRQLHPLY